LYLEKAPSIGELVGDLGTDAVVRAIQSPVDVRTQSEYLHWDKLRRLPPPGDLDSKTWWLKIKLAREADLRRVPLLDLQGQPFGYSLPDLILRHLHHIDQRCSGEVAMDEVVTSERQAGQRFLVNSLMEEAIRSSQLEGATTSRKVAKELLRSGREPKDRSERMISNNYRALQFMRDEMGDRLTIDALLELHKIVTDGTLDDASAAGRFQRPGEVRVAVFDRDDDERPIHHPPPAEAIPGRMDRLCAFANEEDDGDLFIHPVVRAILLHLWLAYDHPFEDGNGRTARILFFWLMRVRGYWLAEYLPISRFIRKAPARYARAFMETELDEGDATYFLLHQLEVIERAIEDLHVYLQRKIAEVRDVEKVLKGTEQFNHRQLALITDAIRHPDASYTFDSHAGSHRVTHETARADLTDLGKQGVLVQTRKGRRYIFEPAPDLLDRLKDSPL
jgi:Fic family protein